MKKRIFACIMAALLLAAVPMTCLAADNNNGKVTFDGGKKLNSDFGTFDVPVLPGSSVTTQIALENETSKATNWYMSNEVLKILENGGKGATGASYTYQLSFTQPNGASALIFDSDSVGGRDSSGLAEVNENLEDTFYLGQIGGGETGYVTLVVGLDGESAVNGYQATDGKLQMNFAVEVLSSGGSGSGGGSKEESDEDGTSVSTATIVSSPKTGDNSQILLYVVLALAAGFSCLAMGIFRLRRQSEDNREEEREV